jgi:hypothetical protein
MPFIDAMVGASPYYAACVLFLTPLSWTGFAMATIYETNSARLGLVLSFVLPYFLVLRSILASIDSQATLTLPMVFGLCSFMGWCYVVHIEQISVRNPKDWAGLVLLALHQRLHVSLGGAALGSIFPVCIQLVMAKVFPGALHAFWTCGLFDLCFGFHQGFCAMSFGWIGSVLAPFVLMIHERGSPDDLAEARSWLLPGLRASDYLEGTLGGTYADTSRNIRQGFTLEAQVFTIPADAFPSSQRRPAGSVVLEVRNLIKPRRRQVDTLVSLLQLRFPALPVEPVSGERSFARIRVSCEHEAVAVASIKAIAK